MRELILMAVLLFTPVFARADTQLYASLLPTMRSVQVGTPATVVARVRVVFLSPLPIPHVNNFYYGETSVAVRTHSPACAPS
jgi:hypothetical protein